MIYLFIAPKRSQKTTIIFFTFVTGVELTSWCLLRPWYSWVWPLSCGVHRCRRPESCGQQLRSCGEPVGTPGGTARSQCPGTPPHRWCPQRCHILCCTPGCTRCGKSGCTQCGRQCLFSVIHGGFTWLSWLGLKLAPVYILKHSR